jgi:hypothetical protein
MHENDVESQTMQPGSKGRFAAKRLDLSKDQQEGFLRQILGFGWIPNHAQAQSIDAAAM